MSADWSNYTEQTTLREAFAMAGLVLVEAETRGFFRVHRNCRPSTLITAGYPNYLYKWLHETHGCPCDSYWLEGEPIND